MKFKKVYAFKNYKAILSKDIFKKLKVWQIKGV